MPAESESDYDMKSSSSVARRTNAWVRSAEAEAGVSGGGERDRQRRRHTRWGNFGGADERERARVRDARERAGAVCVPHGSQRSF